MLSALLFNWSPGSGAAINRASAQHSPPTLPSLPHSSSNFLTKHRSASSKLKISLHKHILKVKSCFDLIGVDLKGCNFQFCYPDGDRYGKGLDVVCGEFFFPLNLKPTLSEGPVSLGRKSSTLCLPCLLCLLCPLSCPHTTFLQSLSHLQG